MKEGKKYLLMIGIDEYVHFNRLRNAKKDVEDISQLLVDEFGYSKDAPYYKELIDEKATRTNIIKVLEELCEIKDPDAKILIYFAGHGCLNPVTELGFWIPVDAKKEDFSDYVSNSDIRDHVKAMKARHVLLISDSCFSHSLFRLAVSGKKNKDAYDYWENHKSRWIFSSGKGVVADGKKGGNSPFAKQIIRRLKEPGVDKINIVGLANEMTIAIRQNYEQQARAGVLEGAGNDGGQFVFFRKAFGGAAISFQDALNSDKQEVLQQFLETAENTKHKKDIREKLKNIEAKEKEIKKIWKKVDKSSFAQLDEFIDEYPESSFLEDAKFLRKKSRTAQPKTQEAKPPVVPSKPILSENEQAQKQEQAPKQKQEGLNISNLVELISQSNFEGVFSDSSLNQWFDRDRMSQSLKNTMILLQSRYNSILKEERQGTISRERISIEKNRITHSLLSLLKSVEKQLKG